MSASGLSLEERARRSQTSQAERVQQSEQQIARDRGLEPEQRRQQIAARLSEQTGDDVDPSDLRARADQFELRPSFLREQALADLQSQTQTQLTKHDITRTGQGFGLTEQAQQEERETVIDQQIEQAAEASDLFGPGDFTTVQQDGKTVIKPRESAVEPERQEQRQSAIQSQIEKLASESDLFGPSDFTTVTQDGETFIQPSESAIQRERQELQQQSLADLEEQAGVDLSERDVTRSAGQVTLNRRGQQKVAAANASEQLGVSVDTSDVSLIPPSGLSREALADQAESQLGRDIQPQNILNVGQDSLTLQTDQGRQQFEVDLSNQLRIDSDVRKQAAVQDLQDDTQQTLTTADITFTDAGPTLTDRALQEEAAQGSSVFGPGDFQIQGDRAVLEEEAKQRERREIREETAESIDERIQAATITADDLVRDGTEFELSRQAQREVAAGRAAQNLGINVDPSEISFQPVENLSRTEVAQQVSEQLDRQIQPQNIVDFSDNSVQLRTDRGGFTEVPAVLSPDVDVSEPVRETAANVQAIERITGEQIDTDRTLPGTVTDAATELALRDELSRQAAVDVAENVRSDVAEQFEQQSAVTVDLDQSDVQATQEGFGLTPEAARANALVGQVEELSGENIQTGADVAGDIPSAIGELAAEGDLSREGATQAADTLRRFQAFQFDTQGDFDTEISAEDVTLGQEGFTLTGTARREEAAADLSAQLGFDVAAGEVTRTDDGFNLTDPARREFAAQQFGSEFQSDVTPEEVILGESSAQLTDEALREEAAAGTEFTPSAFSVQGEGENRQVVRGQVTDPRTPFTPDPQGSVAMLENRDGGDGLTERQQIAAVAQTANETPGVTGADLTFEDGQVQLTDEAAQQQQLEAAAAEFEAALSPEGVNPQAGVGGGSAFAPLTTGPVDAGLAVDITADDVTADPAVFGTQAPTPQPTVAAELSDEQRIGTEALTGTVFGLDEQAQQEIGAAVEQRQEQLAEAPIFDAEETVAADGVTPGTQARADRAEFAQEFAEAGGVFASARSDRQLESTVETQQSLRQTLETENIGGDGGGTQFEGGLSSVFVSERAVATAQRQEEPQRDVSPVERRQQIREIRGDIQAIGLDVVFQDPQDVAPSGLDVEERTGGIELAGPAVELNQQGQVFDFSNDAEINEEAAENLIGQGGFLSEERERELAETAVERQRGFSLGDEAADFVSGFTDNETVESFARGLGQGTGDAAAAPASLALLGESAIEAATNAPGTAEEFGAGTTALTAVDIAGRAAGQQAQFAEENPSQFAGQLTGGLVLGTVASRAVQTAPNVARGASIRARGGNIVDFEELSDPPTRTESDLPGFTEEAQADADVARQEFIERAEDQPLSDDPVAFSGRAPEDVRRFGGFGRDFEAPEGASELPGQFFAADLSNLRLPDNRGGSRTLPRVGLPRPNLISSRVLAEEGVDVGVTEGRTLSEVGEFLAEDADRQQSFIRTDVGGAPTPEQEVIAPPGSRLVDSDGVFGVRVGGRDIPFTDRTLGGEIVTGRLSRRADPDVDAEDIDAETRTRAELAGETTEALTEASRRAEEPTPVTPLLPSGASAVSTGTSQTPETTATARGGESDGGITDTEASTADTTATTTTDTSDLFDSDSTAPIRGSGTSAFGDTRESTAVTSTTPAEPDVSPTPTVPSGFTELGTFGTDRPSSLSGTDVDGPRALTSDVTETPTVSGGTTTPFGSTDTPTTQTPTTNTPAVDTPTQPTSDVPATTFGIPTSAPTETTPASEPPTTPVSEPPSDTTTPPSQPPTLFPPTSPPTQPPTTPPSEPPSVPPSSPPTTPPTQPPSQPPSSPPSGPPAQPPSSGVPGLPPFGPPSSPTRPPRRDDDRETDSDEPIFRERAPEGQRFRNPVASGSQFLFGDALGDSFGTDSQAGNILPGGENTPTELIQSGEVEVEDPFDFNF